MAYILTREKNQQSELEMINAAHHQRRKLVNAVAARPSHISMPDRPAMTSHGSRLPKTRIPEPKSDSFETGLSPSLKVSEFDIDMKKGGANNGEPKQSKKFADS